MKKWSIFGTGTRPGKTILATALSRQFLGFYTRIGPVTDYQHVHQYSPETKFIDYSGFQQNLNGNWVIESDGGILSPFEKGLQIDIFNQPMTYFLVGDEQNISATLLTYEALLNRNIPIKKLCLFQPPKFPFQRFVDCDIVHFPSPPARVEQDPLLDYTNMLVYYESLSPITKSILE